MSRIICWVYISAGESRRDWHTRCPLSCHISPPPLLSPQPYNPASPCLTPPPPTMPQCYLWLFLGCHFSSSEQARPLLSPLSASSFFVRLFLDFLSEFWFVHFTRFSVSRQVCFFIFHLSDARLSVCFQRLLSTGPPSHPSCCCEVFQKFGLIAVVHFRGSFSCVEE